MNRIPISLRLVLIVLSTFMTEGCGSVMGLANASSPQEVLVTPSSFLLAPGQQQNLLLFALGPDGRWTLQINRVKWMVSGTGSAVVASSGVYGAVTALAVGSFSGTGVEDSSSGSFVGQVVPSIAPILWINTTQQLMLDGSARFSAKAFLADGSINDVTQMGLWLSDNPSVISIDPHTGVAELLGKGASSITFVYGPLSDSKQIVL